MYHQIYPLTLLIAMFLLSGPSSSLSVSSAESFANSTNQNEAYVTSQSIYHHYWHNNKDRSKSR